MLLLNLDKAVAMFFLNLVLMFCYQLYTVIAYGNDNLIESSMWIM
jgi:hypothetical protein